LLKGIFDKGFKLTISICDTMGGCLFCVGKLVETAISEDNDILLQGIKAFIL